MDNEYTFFTVVHARTRGSIYISYWKATKNRDLRVDGATYILHDPAVLSASLLDEAIMASRGGGAGLRAATVGLRLLREGSFNTRRGKRCVSDTCLSVLDDATSSMRVG